MPTFWQCPDPPSPPFPPPIPFPWSCLGTGPPPLTRHSSIARALPGEDKGPDPSSSRHGGALPPPPDPPRPPPKPPTAAALNTGAYHSTAAEAGRGRAQGSEGQGTPSVLPHGIPWAAEAAAAAAGGAAAPALTCQLAVQPGQQHQQRAVPPKGAGQQYQQQHKERRPGEEQGQPPHFERIQEVAAAAAAPVPDSDAAQALPHLQGGGRGDEAVERSPLGGWWTPAAAAAAASGMIPSLSTGAIPTRITLTILAAREGSMACSANTRSTANKLRTNTACQALSIFVSSKPSLAISLEC